MENTIETVRYTLALMTFAQQTNPLGFSFISTGGTNADKCSS